MFDILILSFVIYTLPPVPPYPTVVLSPPIAYILPTVDVDTATSPPSPPLPERILAPVVLPLPDVFTPMVKLLIVRLAIIKLVYPFIPSSSAPSGPPALARASIAMEPLLVPFPVIV